MSEQNFFSEQNLNAPSYPNFNHTLLFIETNKYIPAMQRNNQKKEERQNQDDIPDSEISIDANLRQLIPPIAVQSSSTIKKKKTGCICKKTKCLKMYCECFSTGKLCTSECSCCDCINDEHHELQIAQAQEIIKAKTTSAKKLNAGKGCNCRKTQCKKKYCECFNAGIACGTECKCEDCANVENNKAATSFKSESVRAEKGNTTSLLE